MAIGSVLLSYFLGKNKEKEDKDYDEARYKERATAALHNQEQMRMDEETRRPAIELAKRQELADFNRQQAVQAYNNAGTLYQSMLARQNINNPDQAMAILGGVDAPSAENGLKSYHNIAYNNPQLTARQAAAQNLYGANLWEGLNRRNVSDLEATARSSEMWNRGNLANLTRSQGVNESLINRQLASDTAGIGKDKISAIQNSELLANESGLRDLAVKNLLQDRYRATHFTAPSSDDPNLYSLDPVTGTVIAQPNPNIRDPLASLKPHIQNADAIGLPKMGVPVNGPYKQGRVPAVQPAGAAPAPKPINPIDQKPMTERPKVDSITKQVYSNYEAALRNYTKDLSMHDAASVRKRVEEAINEELVDYLDLKPASIGSSIFYHSAEKTIKDAAKDPAIARRIHSISAEEHARILAEALRKAGIQ